MFDGRSVETPNDIYSDRLCFTLSRKLKTQNPIYDNQASISKTLWSIFNSNPAALLLLPTTFKSEETIVPLKMQQTSKLLNILFMLAMLKNAFLMRCTYRMQKKPRTQYFQIRLFECGLYWLSRGFRRIPSR